MYQLTKLPSLFEHYAAHKAGDKSLTICGFLYEHYIVNHPNDPDYAADMQLPFKSHNEYIFSNISSFQSVQQQVQVAIPVHFSELSVEEYQLYKQPSLLSAHLSNVWQPPKA